jgi:quinol monooxygenase YgiN
MNVIVQHRVRDFDAWLPLFKEHRAVREQYGCRSHRVYRGLEEPNEITIVLDFPTRERAEAFYQEPSLREAMERGGVVSEPRAVFVEEADVADYVTRRAA